MSLPEYTTVELRHLAATEQVVHLDDLLMRRTSIAFTGRATPDAAAEVAQVIATAMGWDAETVAAETRRALARVAGADASSSPSSSAARPR